MRARDCHAMNKQQAYAVWMVRTELLGDDIVGRVRRGKPRFGRSLTLPAPNAPLYEICAVVDQDLHQIGGTLIDQLITAKCVPKRNSVSDQRPKIVFIN
jgi:hypothetical protein